MVSHPVFSCKWREDTETQRLALYSAHVCPFKCRPCWPTTDGGWCATRPLSHHVAPQQGGPGCAVAPLVAPGPRCNRPAAVSGLDARHVTGVTQGSPRGRRSSYSALRGNPSQKAAPPRNTPAAFQCRRFYRGNAAAVIYFSTFFSPALFAQGIDQHWYSKLQLTT